MKFLIELMFPLTGILPLAFLLNFCGNSTVRDKTNELFVQNKINAVTENQQQTDRQINIRKIHIDSMRMSDPYILAHSETATYYMTGTGGMLWKSNDLKMWEGPFNVVQIDTNSWMGNRPMIWAAEIHQYNNQFYYFATFTNRNKIIEKIPNRYDIPRRASHVLVSESPEGPYRMIKNNTYTPEDQATLDGTLWVENGIPYMVYCHEWLQIIDGTMDAVQLSPDLSEPVGTPQTLFRASEGSWSREMLSIKEKTYGLDLPGYVTDGPFLFRTKTGKLGMLWSSWGDKRYSQGVVYSASGNLKGPWIHENLPLNTGNSGHGMLFHTFDGKLLMSLHIENLTGQGGRRPVLMEVDDSGDKLRIISRFHP